MLWGEDGPERMGNTRVWSPRPGQEKAVYVNLKAMGTLKTQRQWRVKGTDALGRATRQESLSNPVSGDGDQA